MIWRPAKKRHWIGQSHTVMHWAVFLLDDEFFRECPGWHKCYNGIMQPCKSKTLSSNPEALWGTRVGCYNGDRWSYGLTYFSFWEGLLWPASALNCALFTESKGKPQMKNIWERQQREYDRKRQSNKQTKVPYLKCESNERSVSFWAFGSMDMQLNLMGKDYQTTSENTLYTKMPSTVKFNKRSKSSKGLKMK